MSGDGDNIFVLCHFEEEVLREEAERMEFEIQMEVGSTDLFSLEPCDSKWRPYRLVTDKKPENIKKLEEELQDFFIIIYQDDVDSITPQLIHEQCGISEAEWIAYRSFLTYVQENKNELLRIIYLNKELKGLFIRKFYSEALEWVYKETKFQLLNVWNQFKVPRPVGAFLEYFKSINPFTGEDSAEGTTTLLIYF